MNCTTARLAMTCSMVVLSGCSGTMGLGGTSEFSCPLTGGVTCETVGNVYRMSRNGSLPAKPAGEATPGPAKGEGVPTPYVPQSAPPTAPARPTTVNAALPAASPNAPMRTQASAPPPIRSQPRILRGWIVPYEDADGDLVGESYVFIPVDSGRWMVEHARQKIRDTYAPARPTVAAAAAPAGGSSASSTPAPASSATAQRAVSTFPPPDGAPDLATFTNATQQAAGVKPAPVPGAPK